MLYWVAFLALTLALYTVPGYAISRLVILKELTRGGRFLLALLLSLVVVPYLYGAVGNFGHLVPGLETLAIFTLILFAVGIALRALHLAPVVNLASSVGNHQATRWSESVGIGVVVLILAILVNLPRLGMLVLGDQAIGAATYDEYWHLAQLVSVARSGVPPQHYLFPDLKLVYYYWSWIYPAIIGNQHVIEVSLARAMALHAFVQTGVFLAAAYAFLRMNTATARARLLGLGFFSIFGGFDYFVGMRENEWWQLDVPWIRSGGQISQFVTQYLWVPQHVAGAMAFVLGLIIWRNLRGSIYVRAACCGVLAAFSLGTSPFVFGAGSLVVFLLGWIRRRALWRYKVMIARSLLVFMPVFGLGAFGQGLLMLGHPGSLVGSPFRVPVLEATLGGTAPKFVIADHLLTLVAFPIVGACLLLIEVGLPFLLYLAWGWRVGLKSRVTWDRVLLLFPPMYLLLVYLVTDKGGGGNFEMRGMLPAQILIVMAAARFLDHLRLPVMSRARVALVYLLLLFAGAEVVSPIMEVVGQYALVAPGLADLKVEESNWRAFRVVSKAKHGWLPQLQYVHWINRYTPQNAIIVEMGGPGALDEPRMRLLERLSFMSPEEARTLADFPRDWDFLAEDSFNGLDEAFAGRSALEMWQAEAGRFAGRSAFLVSWKGPVGGLGVPLYHDDYVMIYEIPKAG